MKQNKLFPVQSRKQTLKCNKVENESALKRRSRLCCKSVPGARKNSKKWSDDAAIAFHLTPYEVRCFEGWRMMTAVVMVERCEDAKVRNCSVSHNIGFLSTRTTVPTLRLRKGEVNGERASW